MWYWRIFWSLGFLSILMLFMSESYAVSSVSVPRLEIVYFVNSCLSNLHFCSHVVLLLNSLLWTYHLNPCAVVIGLSRYWHLCDMARDLYRLSVDAVAGKILSGLHDRGGVRRPMQSRKQAGGSAAVCTVRQPAAETAARKCSREWLRRMRWLELSTLYLYVEMPR